MFPIELCLLQELQCPVQPSSVHRKACISPFAPYQPFRHRSTHCYMYNASVPCVTTHHRARGLRDFEFKVPRRGETARRRGCRIVRSAGELEPGQNPVWSHPGGGDDDASNDRRRGSPTSRCVHGQSGKRGICKPTEGGLYLKTE